jgi:hypothetical protein
MELTIKMWHCGVSRVARFENPKFQFAAVWEHLQAATQRCWLPERGT